MAVSSKRSRSWRVAALASVLVVVGAACAEDDDEDASGEGGDEAKTTLTISGPETGSEADGFEAGLAPFTEETGIDISYSGSRDFETQIRVAAEGGDLPDLAVVPQPGLAKALADKIAPVPDDLLESVRDQFSPDVLDLVTVDGDVLGIPNKADVKSLVWYSPKVFADKGYTVPETWDDMLALADDMKADGIAPWCIGIESGEATGWPLTDWIEDVMLRMHGVDTYDQWVNHQMPFNDPKVKDAVEEVEKVWFGEGNVLNGRQSIASTGFKQAGLPVLEGQCGMHKMANFYGADYTDAGATFGEDGDVNVFVLPAMNEQSGSPMLSGGTFIVAFNDNEATRKAMEFLASPDYANARIRANKAGFISPNKEHDTEAYPTAVDKRLAQLLVESDPVRFDGSDLMPSEVGTGSFWKEGTNWVLGSQDLEAFLDNVEASWPDG